MVRSDLRRIPGIAALECEFETIAAKLAAAGNLRVSEIGGPRAGSTSRIRFRLRDAPLP
jgi:hypothetical protein